MYDQDPDFVFVVFVVGLVFLAITAFIQWIFPDEKEN